MYQNIVDHWLDHERRERETEGGREGERKRGVGGEAERAVSAD